MVGSLSTILPMYVHYVHHPDATRPTLTILSMEYSIVVLKTHQSSNFGRKQDTTTYSITKPPSRVARIKRFVMSKTKMGIAGSSQKNGAH